MGILRGKRGPDWSRLVSPDDDRNPQVFSSRVVQLCCCEVARTQVLARENVILPRSLWKDCARCAVVTDGDMNAIVFNPYSFGPTRRVYIKPEELKDRVDSRGFVYPR